MFRHNTHCELMILDHPSFADIADAFQSFRNQIVAFHYGGHADGFRQLLESESGEVENIDARGISGEQPRIYFRGTSTDGDPQGFLFFMVSFVFLGAQLGALINGLTPRMLTTRIRPHQGMYLSRRNGLLVGAISGGMLFVSIILLSLLLNLQGKPLVHFVLFALGSGMVAFVCVGLMFGGLDWLKHLILKGILSATGQIPESLTHFLDYACRLKFMHKAGGGYLFLHRLLQQHFAKYHGPPRSGTSSDPAPQ